MNTITICAIGNLHASNTRRRPWFPKPFADLARTARGERRATVPLRRLETVWFNTGTLCNIACENCYIESSPKNDRLASFTVADVVPFLDELAGLAQPVSLIGFTGGEPFMNPNFMGILEETLSRRLRDAHADECVEADGTPESRHRAAGEAIQPRMRVRVSLDDFRSDVHDAERGEGAFSHLSRG